MPTMNGLQMLERIRNDPGGAAAFLRKPVDTDKLFVVIKNIFSKPKESVTKDVS